MRTDYTASSTAHVRLDTLENYVRKVRHLANNYKSRQRNQDSLLYTPCLIQQASLSTKPSVTSLLKMDSFGLCLSHFV